MKKLKLQLEDLTVEGFSTTSAERARGTVVGEQATLAATCVSPTCVYSCANTCPQTCDDYSCVESCGGTCFQSRCVDSCLCN